MPCAIAPQAATTQNGCEDPRGRAKWGGWVLMGQSGLDPEKVHDQQWVPQSFFFFGGGGLSWHKKIEHIVVTCLDY